MQSERIVLTGMGIKSSNGLDIDTFWGNCLNGVHYIEEIPDHWKNFSKFHSNVWVRLPEIALPKWQVSDTERIKLDPSSYMALGACFDALYMAKVEFALVDKKRNCYRLMQGIDSERIGIFIGTGIGGINSLLANSSYQMFARFKRELAATKETADVVRLPWSQNPFSISMSMPNAPAANISIKFGVEGCVRTYASACASGSVAIGNAFHALKKGEVDMAIAGGVEYLYDEFGISFKGFDAIGALVTGTETIDDVARINRPFDKRRSGFLFSEGGAGILVLEKETSAKKRGAKIFAEVLGYEETSDAFNIMMIEKSGKHMKSLLNRLLKRTGVRHEEIDYINAHGTGTLLNDEIEAAVISELFGRKPLVNSTKSLLGHTIGASGAIEAIVTALSIFHQSTHACLNLEEPNSDLNFAFRTQELPIKMGISQSFAFGGHNSAILFKKYQ